MFFVIIQCLSSNKKKGRGERVVSFLTYFIVQQKNPPKSTGYDNNVLARSDVYDLMLSKIPSHKIFFNKRIETTENIYADKDDDKSTATGVRITCTDGSSYEGDILVAADGAYSAVRHNLYKEVAAKGLLPKPDGLELEVGLWSWSAKLDPWTRKNTQS